MYYHLSNRDLPEEFINMADAITHLSTSVACSVALLIIYHLSDQELKKQAVRFINYSQKVEEKRR